MEYFHLAKESFVAVDFQRGEIADIVYKGVQLNHGRLPMFAVKMRKRTGEKYVIDASECSFVSWNGDVAVYETVYFHLALHIHQVAGELVWKVDIQNKTDDLLEWVELMAFSVEGKLQDEEGGRGAIVYPYNEGCLVTNMEFREKMPFRYTEPEYPSKGSYSIFPNMIFAQFIAYMVDGYGVYLGMHDQERTTKHIDFCYYEDGIKILMRTFCNADYGQNYSMPFDCVMSLTEGDWYAVADRYYAWFSKNLPEGLEKIPQNDALPAWYSEAPIVVAYPIRGKHDTDTSDNGMYPYLNALSLLDEIAERTNGKVMALLMHWEGTAPWAPPYSWPPYGGEDEFCAFVDALHQRGMLAGLYCSGFGWTQQSNVIKEYTCMEAFEELGVADLVCADSNGAINSVICTAQRSGYDLCPANEEVKRIFKIEFEKMCKSGVDYVQALDQNHGGTSYFCYSDKHGHVPAPGKWQQEEVNKLLLSIDKQGVLFGCESAAAEPYLKQLPFSDNRYELNYYVGVPIPLYSYVYHEYVNNFMGNQICAMLEKSENNFTYRLAYSFLAGDMMTLVLNGEGEILFSWCDGVAPIEQSVDKDVAFAMIKTLTEWRNGPCKPFLQYGKMVAPMKIDCEMEQFMRNDGKIYVNVPAALSTAYCCGGKTLQFAVNYCLHDVQVRFDKKCSVCTDSALQAWMQGVEEWTIPPLSMIAIEIKE